MSVMATIKEALNGGLSPRPSCLVSKALISQEILKMHKIVPFLKANLLMGCLVSINWLDQSIV